MGEFSNLADNAVDLCRERMKEWRKERYDRVDRMIESIEYIVLALGVKHQYRDHVQLQLQLMIYKIFLSILNFFACT